MRPMATYYSCRQQLLMKGPSSPPSTLHKEKKLEKFYHFYGRFSSLHWSVFLSKEIKWENDKSYTTIRNLKESVIRTLVLQSFLNRCWGFFLLTVRHENQICCPLKDQNKDVGKCKTEWVISWLIIHSSIYSIWHFFLFGCWETNSVRGTEVWDVFA